MASPWAGNGGKRAGAGRKPSATTVRTREVAERLTKIGGVTPLEVVVLTMQALWGEAVKNGKIVDTGKAKEAAAIAEKALPYMHPRIAAVTEEGDTADLVVKIVKAG